MRGGALPPGLLLAALGLALAFAPTRAWIAGLALAVLAATATMFAPLPATWREAVFLGGWASLAITAAATYPPRGLSPAVVLVLAANAGAWAGAMVSVAGARLDGVRALAGLIAFPIATACVQRGGGIAPKVVASWLIAVAALAAALPFLTVTPGYLPDHLD